MLDRFERFSLAIFEITRHWHKITGDEMEKFSLKGAHSVYLLAMRQHPEGVTATQLCDLCGKDKADVSRMVSILEKKGLVTRAGASPNPYRSLLILTEEGAAAAELVSKRVMVAMALASKGLTDAQRENLYKALELICENLRQVSNEGLPESLSSRSKKEQRI